MLINSMAIQTSAIDMSSFNVDVQKYCVTIISKVNKASRCNQIMPSYISPGISDLKIILQNHKGRYS